MSFISAGKTCASVKTQDFQTYQQVGASTVNLIPDQLSASPKAVARVQNTERLLQTTTQMSLNPPQTFSKHNQHFSFIVRLAELRQDVQVVSVGLWDLAESVQVHKSI